MSASYVRSAGEGAYRSGRQCLLVGKELGGTEVRGSANGLENHGDGKEGTGVGVHAGEYPQPR